MDETQASFSLPRRLPRQPKAAPYPAESAVADIPLAVNVSYFAEDFEVSSPPGPTVSAPSLPAEPSTRQDVARSAEPVQPMQTADRALRELFLPQTASISASESGQNRPSYDDPKPGYARPSGISRSRPSRASGISAAARSSISPAIRKAGDGGVTSTQETRPLRASAKHSAITATANVPQSETRGTADGPLLPVRIDNAAIPSTGESRIVKRTGRRAPRKRRIPAGIALAVLSSILVTYSFAVGSIENEVDRLIVNSDSMPAFVKSMLPWLPLLPLVLLLGIVLWILAGMIGLRRTKHRVETPSTGSEKSAEQRETKHRKAPLELFRDEAQKEGIGKDAAYQAWRLLQGYGPDSHVLSIYDDLQSTLSMTPQQIQRVYQQLVPSAERTVSPHSVLDLMRFVSSPQRITTQRQKAAQ